MSSRLNIDISSPDILYFAVASFMGAGIEILHYLLIVIGSLMSHPLWVRELKFVYGSSTGRSVCRILYGCVNGNTKYWWKACNWCCVASFMGAGIEIIVQAKSGVGIDCRILYGCVNGNEHGGSGHYRGKRRILYGCVNGNYVLQGFNYNKLSRILYGCVNGNIGIYHVGSTWLLSHPLWVRELKFGIPTTRPIRMMSHPLWVRELKYLLDAYERNEAGASHPLWVRELKYQFFYFDLAQSGVASFMGAGIEIFLAVMAPLASVVKVASFMGAGIEIKNWNHTGEITVSHPLWVRELK